MKTKMKKLPHLAASILALLCPLSALAYGGYYREAIIQQLSFLLVVFLIFLFASVKKLEIFKYLRMVIKSKKLFLITIVPLILAPLIFLISFKLGMMEEIKKVEEYKVLYPDCGNNLSLSSSGVEQWGSLSRPCLVLESREPFLSSVNLALNSLLLYYLLIVGYGVYYSKKINRSIGFSILKFCVLMIISIIFIHVALIIMSTTILGI